MAAYLRFVAALIVVLGLIVGAAWLMRRYGFRMSQSLAGGGRGQRRLAVLEALGLDPKRRLMLIRRDDREYLLLLGPAGDLLIDGGEATRFREVLAGTAAAALPDAPAEDRRGGAP